MQKKRRNTRGLNISVHCTWTNMKMSIFISCLSTLPILEFYCKGPSLLVRLAELAGWLAPQLHVVRIVAGLAVALQNGEFQFVFRKLNFLKEDNEISPHFEKVKFFKLYVTYLVCPFRAALVLILAVSLALLAGLRRGFKWYDRKIQTELPWHVRQVKTVLTWHVRKIQTDGGSMTCQEDSDIVDMTSKEDWDVTFWQ